MTDRAHVQARAREQAVPPKLCPAVLQASPTVYSLLARIRRVPAAEAPLYANAANAANGFLMAGEQRFLSAAFAKRFIATQSGLWLC